MSKIELALCRICNECFEQSSLLELFNVYKGINEQIKEVIGVELIQRDDIPNAICRQCNSDFETAQEFWRRCIDSNAYYESKYLDSTIKFEEDFKQEELSLTPQPKSEEETEYINEDHVPIEFENNIIIENNEFGKGDDHEVDTTNTKNSKTKRKKSKKSGGSWTRQHSYKPKDLVKPRKPREASKVQIICDICGNVFKRRHVFALHLRRHSNNKPYGCEICSSTFYTNSELKRHMRRHTGEKPYECQYCHRKFSDYGTHLKHERTHTNDRPFSCNQCDKTFSCAFVLKNHMLVHTGERAFRCEVCNKSFGRQHNLTTHMNSIYHQKNSLKKSNEDKTS